MQIECCVSCRYLIPYPKGNKYDDVDYLCAVTGYFCHGIYKDRNKVKRYTPGGRGLECKYERKA